MPKSLHISWTVPLGRFLCLGTFAVSLESGLRYSVVNVRASHFNFRRVVREWATHIVWFPPSLTI